ncbi:hypothetical protein GIB67_038589 [Kingdonia uniflora]|uniref:WIT1/2 N-terminal helical bundle domain-containing protein n=1 Tax=Kingdonia uniflora TaxID=39325 RepID=A0A7J7NQ43_9MAGN|nr:hypothetical protein GIB67_038589 [Kingdonia uniflora]
MNMDVADVVHETTDVTEVYTGDSNAQSHSFGFDKMLTSNGEGIKEIQSAGETLTRVELDLAYSSEKLLNLEALFMHVASRESDYEVLVTEARYLSPTFAEKGLEFDLLSGILDSEVGEMENTIAALQIDIADVCQKISTWGHLKNICLEIKEKLHDAEESLKQSQKQVSEMRTQSAKFQRFLLALDGQEKCNNNKDAELLENGQFSCMIETFNMQTADQQRHILRMLEKSLARELDLEKKLSDSRYGEEELKRKLQSAEQEVLYLEAEGQIILERLFDAEISSNVLMRASKELIGHIHIVQLNLNCSIQREREIGSKLQKTMKTKGTASLKLEANSGKLDNCLEDKNNFSKSELPNLKESGDLFEGPLRESEIMHLNENSSMSEILGDMLLSPEFNDIEKLIDNLKSNIIKAESRAESLDAKCILLTESNLELNEELQVCANSMEKVNLLEKQLRESSVQLQHAKASIEANQEQQNMLYAAILDMENLVEDLKSKVSSAESRAEDAEEKWHLLSETQLELHEDLNFLRGIKECLETSLQQANDEKIANAKDISIKTKVITDLLLKLAMERKRLHVQVSSLRNEKLILAAKAGNNASVTVDRKMNENVREQVENNGFYTVT